MVMAGGMGGVGGTAETRRGVQPYLVIEHLKQ